MVHLVNLHLDYFNWCGKCYETGVCPIDDGFQEHLKQLFEANVLIVATPSSYPVSYWLHEELARSVLRQSINL